MAATMLNNSIHMAPTSSFAPFRRAGVRCCQRATTPSCSPRLAASAQALVRIGNFLAVPDDQICRDYAEIWIGHYAD
jgi:hypothetical protein